MSKLEIAEPRPIDGPVEVLVEAIQRLSLARELAQVQAIVRAAARRLSGADGATFVLRDGPNCFYADEDAIEPLWKGHRFPLESCISGWVMLNSRSVAIEDIYSDERIPHDAYKPTFVKSLAMVPIRSRDPLGAIGCYWAEHHLASEEELDLIQALADSTAVALENVGVWSQLEERVRERTADLREASEQRERMLHTLSHEVRNPLTAAQLMLEDLAGLPGADAEYGLDDDARQDAADAYRCVSDALRIVDDQLELAKAAATGAGAPVAEPVDVSELLGMLHAVGRALRESEAVTIVVEAGGVIPEIRTDGQLLTQILRNLVGNALKFTDAGEVSIAASYDERRDEVSFAVADTGIGIPEAELETVFEEFAQVEGAQVGRRRGTGLGLPLSRRLATLLGGRLELESELARGSTFTVTLPRTLPAA